MKTVTTYVVLLLCFFSSSVIAQPIEATLIGHWDDPNIVEAFFDNPYHDVWGATINNVEYGIISSTDGFHFFNLSGDGTSMEPVAYAAGTAQGGGIAHRDMKVYQNYLYAVADEGPSALQVFDMSVLPDDPVLVYESNEFLVTSHNIFIDEDNGVLYAAGGNGFSLKLLSLEDPENPTLLGTFPSPSFPNLPYIHDLYVRDNIAYLNASFFGLIVMDFTDPASPQVLGTMDTYIQQGYNHSGWQSEDGDYYFMCDETHGTDIKVVDVRDLSDINVIATMNAASTSNQIVHNVYVQGDLLYASYYYDGLQVFDISNPNFPRRVAYYDTSDLTNTSYFGGAWGIFVLPSGRALISDMNNGFYFFETLNLPANTVVTPSTPSIEACIGEVTEFEIWVGDDFEGTVTLDVENSDEALDITIGATEVAPGDVVTVSVSASISGDFELKVGATDGTTTSETVISVDVAVFPETPNLLAPSDERENVSITPLFLWQNVDPDAFSVRLELSTDEDNFDDNIFHTETVTTSSIFLDFELDGNTTYFWRLVSTYPCGDNPTEIFSFTTKITTSVTEIGGNAFQLAPNPAKEFIQLTFEQGLNERIQVDLQNLSGQQLFSTQVGAGENNLRIDLNTLPSGVYVLRLRNSETTIGRRIVVD